MEFSTLSSSLTPISTQLLENWKLTLSMHDEGFSENCHIVMIKGKENFL